jgi:hypothetical protein
VAKRRVHQGNPAIRNREWSRMFFDAAKNPTDWLRIARKLRSSADVIFEREKPIAAKALNELQRLLAEGKPEDPDIKGYAAPNLDAGYMLIAFAIENLLKGLIVAKGTVDAINPHRLFDKLFTDNLVDLNDLAEPKATIAPHLLDALTYMAEWRARYPTPTWIDLFWPMDEEGKIRTGVGLWPGDYSDIFRYSDELEAELSALISKT